MRKLKISSILIFLLLLLSILFISSCGVRNKNFYEMKDAYTYDSRMDLFIKLPSQIYSEENEFMEFNGKKAQSLEYQTREMTIEKTDETTNKFCDYIITLNYLVKDGNIVLAEVPLQLSDYKYLAINGSTDKVIILTDNYNAYRVDMNDFSYERLYSPHSETMKQNKNLVYAKTISISPNGRYLIYLTNRDYIYTGNIISYDLYCYDLSTGDEYKIMDFTDTEFLSWEKDSNLSFLYRTKNMASKTGAISYSDIRKYSLDTKEDSTFKVIEEPYKNYEIVNDEYIYSMPNKGNLYLINIYTNKIISLDSGKYNSVHDMKISDTGEYLAFWGTYMDSEKKLWEQFSTCHIETNDIVSYYEGDIGTYYIGSHYWYKDNILTINFINTKDLFEDKCRFFNINHFANTKSAS